MDKKDFYTKSKIESFSPVPEAYALMTENLRKSGELIRQNVGKGFMADLENGRHYFERKTEMRRVTGRVAKFNEWVVTVVKVSDRTARRHIRFYVALCVDRPDILDTVDHVWLSNTSSTNLQKIIALEKLRERGEDTGEYIRTDVEYVGIFLVFGSCEPENRYDLNALSSRDIDDLVKGNPLKSKAKKSARNTDKPTKPIDNGEAKDDSMDEVLKLRKLVAELGTEKAELKSENRELEASNTELKATNARQATRITEVEAERDSLRQKLYPRTSFGEQAVKTLEAILEAKIAPRKGATSLGGTQLSTVTDAPYPSSSSADSVNIQMELDADGKGARMKILETAGDKAPQLDDCTLGAEAV